jgi:uncharacterized membrane protein (DUF373 family)
MDIINITNRFEKGVYGFLIALLMLVLIASIFDLILIMYQFLLVETSGILETNEIITLLGFFLLVLIGFELLDTIKAYFKENSIHVEVIILLAIIAMSRKVILLDSKGTNGLEFGIQLIGNGVIVICLASGYYLLKKADSATGTGEHEPVWGK